MNIDITPTSDASTQSATLHVVGELDYLTTGALVDAASAQIVGTPLRHLRLDLEKLTFCDSAGLSGLIQIRRWTAAAGVHLHLDNRSAAVDRVLELTGTLDYLTAAPGVETDEGETRYEGGGSNS